MGGGVEPDEFLAAFTTLWNIGGAGFPLVAPDRVEPHNRALREAARSIGSWAYVEAVTRIQQSSRRAGVRAGPPVVRRRCRQPSCEARYSSTPGASWACSTVTRPPTAFRSGLST